MGLRGRLTAAAISLGVIALTAPASGALAAGPPLSIGVASNYLVDGNGTPIRLLGVNRSGTEYACIQGWGIFDGPNDATSVAAMAAWHINAVRVPLNEDAVRSTGATQPIMLGGLAWANDLSGWLANQPVDPAQALVASFHNYNFNVCAPSCWDSTVATLAGQVPVVTGEMGENDCLHGYIDQYMAWADVHGISYLGWTWDTWNCSNGPALITDYAGTPTAFGIGLRDHLAAVANPLRPQWGRRASPLTSSLTLAPYRYAVQRPMRRLSPQ